jgi:hypothetical protein
MKTPDATRTTNEPADIGDDLQITRIAPRRSCGGTWVHGTIAGHRFQALVFEAHAEVPEWEYGTSRISKLWVQRIADDVTVFNFDRGADVEAADATTSAIVGFLAEGIADFAGNAS